MKKKSFYDHAMTEERIEQELDQIFKDLKYAPKEYPYESGWREDGCTTKMVLRFCQNHDIICHVFHNAVKNGSELESYTPSGADCHTPRVDFFRARRPLLLLRKTPFRRDAMSGQAGYLAYVEGSGRRRRGRVYSSRSSRREIVPPFSEWLSSWRLMADAPDFGTYKLLPRERN